MRAAALRPSEAPEADLAECLIGSWLLPEDQVVAFSSAAAAGLSELSFEPFGTLGLDLGVDGDVLVLSQANSSPAVSAELDGQPLDAAAATDELIEASPMLTPPGAVACDADTLAVPMDAGTGGIIEAQWVRAG